MDRKHALARPIDFTATARGAAVVAAVLLLGGCDGMSCQLSNALTARAPGDNAGSSEPSPPTVAEESPEAQQAAGRAEVDPAPAQAEAGLIADTATLAHFKAFADDGWRPTLSAKLDVTVSDGAEAERLYVHGKGRCHADGKIATSTASVQLSRLDSWNLDLFSDHEITFDHCQIDLRLGGEDGAISRPLGTYCFVDGSTVSGECPQSVEPTAPPPGADVRMLDTKLKFEDGLQIAFEFQPSTNAGHELELVSRTVCLVNDTQYLQSESVTFTGGAFDFLPGETYGGKLTAFSDEKWDTLKLDETTCQITFEAIDETLFGDEQPHRIHTVCSQDGELSDGPCKGFPSANFAKSDDFDAVNITDVNARIAPGSFGSGEDVRFELDVSASGPVGGTLYPEMECKTDAGKHESSVRWDGTDAATLRKGESSRVWLSRFGDTPSLDGLDWCELRLTRLGVDEPFARYCWDGKKVREKACS